jgi:hypothetical protein
MQKMEKSLYEKMRGKARNVDLNATYRIEGQNMQHQQCRIANLSASGATALFPLTESLKSGAVIAMDIAKTHTIMRIETKAEIMWARHRFNEIISGMNCSSCDLI